MYRILVIGYAKYKGQIIRIESIGILKELNKEKSLCKLYEVSSDHNVDIFIYNKYIFGTMPYYDKEINDEDSINNHNIEQIATMIDYHGSFITQNLTKADKHILFIAKNELLYDKKEIYELYKKYLKNSKKIQNAHINFLKLDHENIKIMFKKEND